LKEEIHIENQNEEGIEVINHLLLKSRAKIETKLKIFLAQIINSSVIYKIES
jgi:hypothetical protein